MVPRRLLVRAHRGRLAARRQRLRRGPPCLTSTARRRRRHAGLQRGADARADRVGDPARPRRRDHPRRRPSSRRHASRSRGGSAKSIPLVTIPHPHNVGYGGNQKTCYMEALRRGADVVVMVHPDGQYDPDVPARDRDQPIFRGEADVVLGSRMLRAGGAREGGMPLVEAPREPLPDRAREPRLPAAALRVLTPAIAPSAGASSRPCRSCATAATSSSTRRCWRRRSRSTSASREIPVDDEVLRGGVVGELQGELDLRHEDALGRGSPVAASGPGHPLAQFTL